MHDSIFRCLRAWGWGCPVQCGCWDPCDQGTWQASSRSFEVKSSLKLRDADDGRTTAEGWIPDLPSWVFNLVDSMSMEGGRTCKDSG